MTSQQALRACVTGAVCSVAVAATGIANLFFEVLGGVWWSVLLLASSGASLASCAYLYRLFAHHLRES